ncbi:MAG TPA: protein kinase, partial [Terriglobia bacterium]|nr:protein kinase [Terriglobia bacterium]
MLVTYEQLFMIGKLLGHYRIVSKLGEGGMGVVYRAHDQVLQRDVALKFLTGTLGQEARQFLLREARAASSLSHPNICTIHEVGEADGEFYIVMELIEGKPLNGSIGSSGGLAYETVMRYGAQIAAALTH